LKTLIRNTWADNERDDVFGLNVRELWKASISVGA
jgi:hypothetical protein